MTLSSALTRPRLPRRRERAGFRAALRKAGLGATAGSLHSLRDSFASLLIAKGLNVLSFSRRLRHAGPNVTLEVYVHLDAQADHATAADASGQTNSGASRPPTRERQIRVTGSPGRCMCSRWVSRYQLRICRLAPSPCSPP
jgi:hypothetical protein